MVGACEISAGKKADGLDPAWISGIKNGQTITEHVADIEMPTIQHHLNTVRPASNVAIGHMTNAVSDALRRNRLLRHVRDGRQTHQGLYMFAAIHGFHGEWNLSPDLP